MTVQWWEAVGCGDGNGNNCGNIMERIGVDVSGGVSAVGPANVIGEG